MNQWKIAWNNGGGYNIIEPQSGTYEADPFIFHNHLFFELYDYKKGVIAVRPFPDGPPTVILEENHHLSFPCVWEECGNVYMMPETGAGDIVIYQCDIFPYYWREVSRIPGVFGDSIYFQGLIITTEANDNLLTIFKDNKRIFQVERPNSRAAGNIFSADGRWYRPCQLTEGGYGGGIVIKEFNPITFGEKEMSRHLPWNGTTGLHTFNQEDNNTVIDLRFTYEEEVHTT